MFGVPYSLGKQAYQHQKAIFRRNVFLANQIMDASNVLEVKKIGRLLNKVSTGDWDSVRVDVIEQVLLAHFHQQSRFLSAILARSGSWLCHNVNDQFWGYFKDDGMNIYGSCLMRLRHHVTNNGLQ